MSDIRPIEAQDDRHVAKLIREVMTEFGAVGPEYSIVDTEVDNMSGHYGDDRSIYYVSEIAGHIVGGAGVAPLKDGDQDTCELRKMYIYEGARGYGVGRELMALCLIAARELGFKKMYLETLKSMDTANVLYEKVGFKALKGPLGCTGHTGCDLWYALDL